MAEERVVLELDLDSSKAAEAAKKVVEIEDQAQRRRSSSGSYESRFIDRGRLEEEIDRKRMQREDLYSRMRIENLKKYSQVERELGQTQAQRYAPPPPPPESKTMRASKDPCDCCIICCGGGGEGRGQSPAGGTSGPNEGKAASAISRTMAMLDVIEKGARAIGEAASAINHATIAQINAGGSESVFMRHVLKNHSFTRPLVDTFDAITGRDARVSESEQDHLIKMTRIQAQAGGNFENYRYGSQTMQAAANYAAAQVRYGGPAMSSFNQSSALGTMLAEEERRRMPLRESLTEAERNKARVDSEAISQQKRLNEIMKEEQKKRKELTDSINNQELFKNRGGLDQSAEGLRLTRETIESREAWKSQRNLLQEAEKDITRIRENAARANAEVAKAQTALRADLPNAQARLQSAERNAQTIGRMRPHERFMAMNALQAMKWLGPDSIPDEMRAQAEAFAPKETQRIYEKNARNDPFGTWKMAEAMAPADFRAGDRPDNIRKLIAEAEDNIRTEAQKQNEIAAKQISKLVETMAKEIGMFVEQRIEQAVQKVSDQLRAAAHAK